MSRQLTYLGFAWRGMRNYQSNFYLTNQRCTNTRQIAFRTIHLCPAFALRDYFIIAESRYGLLLAGNGLTLPLDVKNRGEFARFKCLILQRYCGVSYHFPICDFRAKSVVGYLATVIE